MPLKLEYYPSRSKNYYIRGTYLGQSVYKSTGTSKERVAQRLLVEEERRIERGQPRQREELAEYTFLDAVTAYVDAGKPERFLEPLIGYFRATPVKDIGQVEVDTAARILLPKASAATRVRQVYSPMSAVLNFCARLGWRDRASFTRPRIVRKDRRAAPVGWIVSVTDHAPPHLAALVFFMFSTGARISEATSLKWEHVNLQDATARLFMSKVNRWRTVRLAPDVVAAIANIPDRTERVFKYSNRSGVYNAVRKICADRKLPYYSTHEFGRHAMATELLRQGKRLKYVQEAGGWASIRIVADTYSHLEQSDVEAARDDLMGSISAQKSRSLSGGDAK